MPTDKRYFENIHVEAIILKAVSILSNYGIMWAKSPSSHDLKKIAILKDPLCLRVTQVPRYWDLAIFMMDDAQDHWDNILYLASLYPCPQAYSPL